MKRRRSTILSVLDPKGVGLEIGPCNHPIAPKSEGFNVEIIDWTSEQELRERYKDDPDLKNIEEVDYVWSGGSYAELIGETNKYDWIIASHVIEHVPDLIAFLQSCQEILKPQGVLSLAIPDKRYCFDHLRSVSTLGAVLNAHYSGDTKPSVGAVADYFLNISNKGGNLAWGQKMKASAVNELYYSHDFAIEKYKESLNGGSYIDVHNWCFTPSSFRLILGDLYKLGFIRFQESAFFPSAGSEFFVALSETGKGCSLSRLELLEASLNEQMKPYKSKVTRMLEKLF